MRYLLMIIEKWFNFEAWSLLLFLYSSMMKESRFKPFDPKLAMAIKITIVTLLCIIMFVIVQVRNELRDLRPLSEIEHSDTS